MKLTLSPLSNSKAIKLTLSDGHRQWEEIAPTGDDLVGTLDKILKNANMGVTHIETVKVLRVRRTSLTSKRLAKTFQQALNIGLSRKA